MFYETHLQTVRIVSWKPQLGYIIYVLVIVSVLYAVKLENLISYNV